MSPCLGLRIVSACRCKWQPLEQPQELAPTTLNRVFSFSFFLFALYYVLLELLLFGAETPYLGEKGAFRKEQHWIQSIQDKWSEQNPSFVSCQGDRSGWQGDRSCCLSPSGHCARAFRAVGLSAGLVVLPWVGGTVPLCRDHRACFRRWRSGTESSWRCHTTALLWILWHILNKMHKRGPCPPSHRSVSPASVSHSAGAGQCVALRMGNLTVTLVRLS